MPQGTPFHLQQEYQTRVLEYIYVKINSFVMAFYQITNLTEKVAKITSQLHCHNNISEERFPVNTVI